MVDKTDPTTQFHPYQAIDAVPQSEKSTSNLSGLNGILNKVGINPDAVSGMMKNVDVKGSVASMRSKVNSKNSGLILGGLAALVIGAGLLRKRGNRGA